MKTKSTVKQYIFILLNMCDFYALGTVRKYGHSGEEKRLSSKIITQEIRIRMS